MRPSGSGSRRGLLVVLVLMVYGLSMFLPSFDIPFGENPSPGWEVVWMGWDAGLAAVPWSANIVMIVGLIALGLGTPSGAIAAAGIGLALASTSLLVVERPFETLHAGFYVWTGSFIVLGVAAALSYYMERQGDPPPED